MEGLEQKEYIQTVGHLLANAEPRTAEDIEEWTHLKHEISMAESWHCLGDTTRAAMILKTLTPAIDALMQRCAPLESVRQVELIVEQVKGAVTLRYPTFIPSPKPK